MAALEKQVRSFVELVTSGRSVEAIETFYAEDVTVFENRELARAGREECAADERRHLASQPEPPRLRALHWAVNESDGVAFIEWLIRFTSSKGRPMRLEEVAVQKWENGRIVEERFYYEGFVDEGD
jgi:ketosteroid isomerase-like protein